MNTLIQPINQDKPNYRIPVVASFSDKKIHTQNLPSDNLFLNIALLRGVYIYSNITFLFLK